RLGKRLSFLAVVAELWKMSAQNLETFLAASPGETDPWPQVTAWLTQAQANQEGLQRLVAEVDAYRLPAPRSSQESMVEYDRRRIVKETLLERIVNTSVAMADSARALRTALPADVPCPACLPWQVLSGAVWRAMTRGDVDEVRQQFAELLLEL